MALIFLHRKQLNRRGDGAAHTGRLLPGAPQHHPCTLSEHFGVGHLHRIHTAVGGLFHHNGGEGIGLAIQMNGRRHIPMAKAHRRHKIYGHHRGAQQRAAEKQPQKQQRDTRQGQPPRAVQGQGGDGNHRKACRKQRAPIWCFGPLLAHIFTSCHPLLPFIISHQPAGDKFLRIFLATQGEIW